MEIAQKIKRLLHRFGINCSELVIELIDKITLVIFTILSYRDELKVASSVRKINHSILCKYQIYFRLLI